MIYIPLFHYDVSNNYIYYQHVIYIFLQENINDNYLLIFEYNCMFFSKAIYSTPDWPILSIMLFNFFSKYQI